MNKDDHSKIKINRYEYIWYWLVTLVVIILAVPILLIKTIVFIYRMVKR